MLKLQVIDEALKVNQLSRIQKDKVGIT